ncbi:MAG: ATP-binding protein [Candidatus Nanopelagicales bacterium]
MALHAILDNNPCAPREARHAIAEYLETVDLQRLTDDAELLTSELVTNAVRHASGPIDVLAYVHAGYLRIEVADADTEHSPSPRTADPDDEGGRGMELVSKLSARWGWRAAGHSKVVWFDLTV